jgi:DedD protein
MAERDDAHTEFNPKHRIVGAIIIVALVVIFVPMILDQREPPPDVRTAGEPVARGEIADTRVVVTPVAPEEPRAAGTGAAASNNAAPAAESAPTPQTPPAAPVEKPAPAKKPPAAPANGKTAKASPAAEKITKGWIVQVGTFSNKENAIHLRSKLSSHGHAVHTETVKLAGKTATRLRVGPFRDKGEAEKVQAQIRKETGVQGVVQTYP